jgi:TonB family protein
LAALTGLEIPVPLGTREQLLAWWWQFPLATPAPPPVTQRKDPPLGDLAVPSQVDDQPAEDISKAAALAEPATGNASAETDSAGGSRFGKPLFLGIGAVVAVAVAGTLFWMMSGDEAAQDAPDPVATISPSITEADFGLGEAAEEPVDNRALVNEALAAVETAMLESRLEEAAEGLQQVADLDPGNARLPFLTAQLSQMQLRGYLDGASNAIRDTRFEDAANLIASAQALGLSEAPEIDAVADELAAARSDQRVDETLALAAARLEEGDLLAPVNDNARYYYELVLSNAPDNASARQGLNVIASKLVLQARAEIDSGNLDAAEDLLEDAGAMDAASDELAATVTALQSARAAIAERERLAEEARRQQEADRRAAAEAEAEAAAAQQAVVDDAAAVDTSVDATETAPEPLAATGIAEDAEAVSTEAAPVDSAPVEEAPVPISSLTRTRYVAPKYPRAAERRGESGWVDIVFTVTVDGTVSEVEVRESMPDGLFDQAAVRAAEKWEFEPVIENGRVVAKRAGVRMMFALE